VRAPADDKPPPLARNERDRQWMERWLNAKLDQILYAFNRPWLDAIAGFSKAMKDDPDFQRRTSDQLAEFRAQRNSGGAVIEAAQRGDLAPARKKYPELAAADMLKLPARPGRGKRFPKVKDREPDLTEAVWDAAKIRRIWKRHYPRRPRGYDSPEAMAARRNGVDEERVRGWAKNRRCKKIPPNLLDVT
jgi:hypothetical protein